MTLPCGRVGACDGFGALKLALMFGSSCKMLSTFHARVQNRGFFSPGKLRKLVRALNRILTCAAQCAVRLSSFLMLCIELFVCKACLGVWVLGTGMPNRVPVIHFLGFAFAEHRLGLQD
jgi:hypothetical protein